LRAKADLAGVGNAAPDSIAASSVTGQGLPELLRRVEDLARSILPDEGAIALNRRQALHLEEAAASLERGAGSGDHVIVAENLRMARSAFDRLTGRAGVEDVLDALFGRFCLGK
jgi:tRNA modification GTPase